MGRPSKLASGRVKKWADGLTIERGKTRKRGLAARRNGKRSDARRNYETRTKLLMISTRASFAVEAIRKVIVQVVAIELYPLSHVHPLSFTNRGRLDRITLATALLQSITTGGLIVGGGVGIG